MGPVKRVLLGSAAGIFAVTGAQAADLVVKAKPVEYVKVCSLYGAGFWYVPGTDTCIKIGAFTNVRLNWNAGGASSAPAGFGTNMNSGFLGFGDAGGRQTRTDTGNLNFRNRNAISFDLRTQTEYGTLRSYVDVGTQIAAGLGDGGLNGLTNPNQSTMYASRAFIQFAGFTVGRIRSFFDMFNVGNFSYVNGQTTGDTSVNGIYGLAYTWQFGGGLSASLSFEDGGFSTGGRGRTTTNLNLAGINVVSGGETVLATQNAPFGVGNQFTDIKGQTTLDPVLNVRLDQQWGFVGVSGAIHDASGGYYGTSNSTVNGHPSDKFGWAVAGSFLLTNAFGLQGDTIGVMGVFSRGAAGYATANWGAKAAFGSGNNVGVGWITDGVYVAGSQVELTDVWSVTGAYEHLWNPAWKTSVYGGFVGVSYDNAAKGFMCGANVGGAVAAPVGFTLTNVSNCNPDFSYSLVGTRTQWSPVTGLDVGLDLTWTHINTAFAGTATLTGTGARPAGTYNINDQDVFSAIFHVQRTFMY
jgi:hypothetical protein